MATHEFDGLFFCSDTCFIRALGRDKPEECPPSSKIHPEHHRINLEYCPLNWYGIGSDPKDEVCICVSRSRED